MESADRRYSTAACCALLNDRATGYREHGSTLGAHAVDAEQAPLRLEDLVTHDDYVALLEIAARIAAECAALGHTRLLAEFREVE